MSSNGDEIEVGDLVQLIQLVKYHKTKPAIWWDGKIGIVIRKVNMYTLKSSSVIHTTQDEYIIKLPNHRIISFSKAYLKKL